MANEKRLIDANEMKNNIMEAMMRQFEMNGDQTALRIAEMMWHFIDVTDAVDAVEVVHAQWITKDGNIHCSHCDFTSATAPGYEMMVYNGEKWVSLEKTNYCPNCGAKMDGERKDDE